MLSRCYKATNLQVLLPLRDKNNNVTVVKWTISLFSYLDINNIKRLISQFTIYSRKMITYIEMMISIEKN